MIWYDMTHMLCTSKYLKCKIYTLLSHTYLTQPSLLLHPYLLLSHTSPPLIPPQPHPPTLSIKVPIWYLCMHTNPLTSLYYHIPHPPTILLLQVMTHMICMYLHQSINFPPIFAIPLLIPPNPLPTILLLQVTTHMTCMFPPSVWWWWIACLRRCFSMAQSNSWGRESNVCIAQSNNCGASQCLCGRESIVCTAC